MRSSSSRSRPGGRRSVPPDSAFQRRGSRRLRAVLRRRRQASSLPANCMPSGRGGRIGCPRPPAGQGTQEITDDTPGTERAPGAPGGARRVGLEEGLGSGAAGLLPPRARQAAQFGTDSAAIAQPAIVGAERVPRAHRLRPPSDGGQRAGEQGRRGADRIRGRADRPSSISCGRKAAKAIWSPTPCSVITNNGRPPRGRPASAGKGVAALGKRKPGGSSDAAPRQPPRHRPLRAASTPGWRRSWRCPGAAHRFVVERQRLGDAACNEEHRSADCRAPDRVRD